MEKANEPTRPTASVENDLSPKTFVPAKDFLFFPESAFALSSFLFSFLSSFSSLSASSLGFFPDFLSSAGFFSALASAGFFEDFLSSAVFFSVLASAGFFADFFPSPDFFSALASGAWLSSIE